MEPSELEVEMTKRFLLFGSNFVLSARDTDRLGDFNTFGEAKAYADENSYKWMVVMDRYNPKEAHIIKEPLE